MVRSEQSQRPSSSNVTGGKARGWGDWACFRRSWARWRPPAWGAVAGNAWRTAILSPTQHCSALLPIPKLGERLDRKKSFTCGAVRGLTQLVAEIRVGTTDLREGFYVELYAGIHYSRAY